MKNLGISPLIEKYGQAFEKDKTSKVFAPLAEGYRQAGLIDKAMEIIKVGIRHNPTYLQGYLALANCYVDLGEFNLSYSTLRPLVADNRDNIRLQKLFASSCLELGHKEEALDAYKYLLFLNPRDEEVSKNVKLLEGTEETYESPKVIIPKQEFEIEEIDVKPEMVKSSLDEWIKVDLKSNNKETKEIAEEKEPEVQSDNWNVARLDDIRPEKTEIIVEDDETLEKSEEPVITHSLVDLYINQGHLSKAKELLQKIIELNPNEKSSLLKLEEVNKIESSSRLEVEAEEEGHQRLLDSLDEKLGQDKSSIEELQSFLDAIQKRAETRKNSSL